MVELFIIWLAAYIAVFLRWYIVPFVLEAPKLAVVTPNYPKLRQRMVNIQVGSVFNPAYKDRENKHVGLPRVRDGTG